MCPASLVGISESHPICRTAPLTVQPAAFMVKIVEIFEMAGKRQMGNVKIRIARLSGGENFNEKLRQHCISKSNVQIVFARMQALVFSIEIYRHSVRET